MNRHHAIETAPPAAMRRAEPQGWAGLDVRDIVQLVWSARWAIAICGFLGAAAAFAFVKQVTPQYRSSASVMLDIRDQNVINLESVLSDTPLNRQLLESELLVIRSDVLLGEVVDKLRLDLDPEYNPSLAQPSEMEALIADKRAAFLEMTGIGEFFAARRAAAEAELAAEAAAEAEAAEAIEAPIQTAEERERAEAEERRRRAIRILRGKLTTRQLSPAYAIRVEVVSADPMKAALIANTVADQYVADQLEAKFEAARRA
ncbi:MAG: Wzz/FepE/Etk N-terminal domain-containing protein, partial [Pseudomonadota bacterium]